MKKNLSKPKSMPSLTYIHPSLKAWNSMRRVIRKIPFVDVRAWLQPSQRLIAYLMLMLSCASPNLLAMNNDEARRILADEPFMPGAGETPQAYRQRVNEYKNRQKMQEELAQIRSEVAILSGRAKKLMLQIQTGMLIPEGENAKPTELTEANKAELLKELLRIQETISVKQARARDLIDDIEQDDEHLQRQGSRQAIQDAMDRQTQEILQKIRDGNLRDCR